MCNFIKHGEHLLGKYSTIVSIHARLNNVLGHTGEHRILLKNIKIEHQPTGANFVSLHILRWSIWLLSVCRGSFQLVSFLPEMCPCQQHDHMWRFVVLVLTADGWCWVRWLWDTASDLYQWSTLCSGSEVVLAQKLWWNRHHSCSTRKINTTF